MPRPEPPAFADRLLSWWDVHGRKDLPWQHPRSPYRVWISEVMLQQTQVSTVIPYFQRWVRDFPDISKLSAASLDDVLARWSGLGYYARARNLHKAATLCVEQHSGELPLEPNALIGLPGIGQSTANAIISQATDRPAAVLDGNVRRVLARHAMVEGWSGRSVVQKRLWREAESRLPAHRGADYTQAIMDLGATLCTRRSPGCEQCPVAKDCQARSHNRVAEFPAPKPATRIRQATLKIAIVREGGRVLLERRPPSGIWGGLWCLPDLDGLGLETRNTRALDPVLHRLSHVQMTLQPYLVDIPRAGGVKYNAEHDWFDAGQQARLGLPRPIADLLNRLNKGDFE